MHSGLGPAFLYYYSPKILTEGFDWNEGDSTRSSSLRMAAMSGSREIGLNRYKVSQEAVAVPGLQGISPLRGAYEHVIFPEL